PDAPGDRGLHGAMPGRPRHGGGDPGSLSPWPPAPHAAAGHAPLTKMAATDGAPRRLGPYRIDGRLGSGGMGEVFAAYDERLERRVAIKLVRPAAAADAGAPERPRRAAPGAARLS